MDKKETNDTKIKLLHAALQKPYKFGVSDRAGKVREFNIYPPCLNCLLAVSELFTDIELKEVLDTETETLTIIRKHGRKMAKAAMFIVNNTDKENEEDYNFILDNLNAKELHEIFIESITRMGISDFRKSIIASQAMSLMNDRETIALLKGTMEEKHLTPGN